jgi:hypothetical protein
MFKIVVETIINGSLRVVNTQLIYGDTTSGQGIITRAYDNGVFYSLVDNTVTNGLTYYYRVAGYDLNFVTNPSSAIDTISLESNPTPVSIRPRWEAPNYTSDTVNIIRVIGDMVHPGVKYRPNIVIPYEVTSDTLKIEYAGPKYGGASNKALYRFTVKTLNDSLVLDTTRYSINNYLLLVAVQQ